MGQREKGPSSIDPLFSIGYRAVTFCFRVEAKIRRFSWILLFSRLFSYGSRSVTCKRLIFREFSF
jgi:hypothetical protein